MFERILVPLDGSLRAELVLSLVGRILRREDSEILLVRVMTYPGWFGKADLRYLQDAEREEAQKYIDRVVSRLSAKGMKVHGRVVDGSAADVILDTARSEGATLIALSTHGRSGFMRWALGSVAEKIARAADIPLLLLRSFRRSPKGELEPVISEELPFRRILVPVDGSPTSMSIVTPAEHLAQLYGSEILVVHVRTPLVPASPVLPGMEAALPLVQPHPPPAAEDESTEKAAERFRQAGLSVRRLSLEGDPASEILDLSETENVDLIALGTHGRSGLSRWALGSVAERVLRSATVPLLLIRTPSPK